MTGWKRELRFRSIVVAALLASVAVASAQDEIPTANCILELTGADGKKVGDICVTSSDVSFDGNQNLARGAGYVQAVEGQYVNATLFTKCTGKDAEEVLRQLVVPLSRVEWDVDGLTTKVLGLEGVIRSSRDKGELRITSTLAKPVVRNGDVVVTVAGTEGLSFLKGDLTLPIRFGGYGSPKFTVSSEFCGSD